jgi:hypothetical protein
MFSLLKSKVCKENIYIKKHLIQMFSIEEIESKFATSKNKLYDVADFYLNKINLAKFHMVLRWICNADGKKPMNINQIENALGELVMEALRNYFNNKVDAVYISENILVSVSSYNGKHYLSVCPRYDFCK